MMALVLLVGVMAGAFLLWAALSLVSMDHNRGGRA